MSTHRLAAFVFAALLALVAGPASAQYAGVHATGVSDINNVHEAASFTDVLSLATTVTAAGGGTGATQWVGFGCDASGCFGVHRTGVGEQYNVWRGATLADVLNLSGSPTLAGGGTGAQGWIGFAADGTHVYGFHTTRFADQYNVVRAATVEDVLALNGDIRVAGVGSSASQWVGFASDGFRFYGIHRTAVPDTYNLWQATTPAALLNLDGTATQAGAGTGASSWRGFAAVTPAP